MLTLNDDVMVAVRGVDSETDPETHNAPDRSGKLVIWMALLTGYDVISGLGSN